MNLPWADMALFGIRNGHQDLILLMMQICFITMDNTPFRNSTRKGWGHSNFNDVLQFASITDVKHLLIGHHDPSHTDSQLTTVHNDLKRENSFDFNYEFAVEGKQFDLR